MEERYTVVERPTNRKKTSGDVRRWSIWENDESEDGRLVASEMLREDAETIAHHLNGKCQRTR